MTMEMFKKLLRLDYDSIKEQACQNWARSNFHTPASFQFYGHTIVNPWVDPSGKYIFTDDQMIDFYGIENIIQFFLMMDKELNS